MIYKITARITSVIRAVFYMYLPLEVIANKPFSDNPIPI